MDAIKELLEQAAAVTAVAIDTQVKDFIRTHHQQSYAVYASMQYIENLMLLGKTLHPDHSHLNILWRIKPIAFNSIYRCSTYEHM